MLNISLDEEAERDLIEILKYEQMTSGALIKQLLRERLETVKPQQTVLERMGGMPQHLLSVGGLSERENRREMIAAQIEARDRVRSE